MTELSLAAYSFNDLHTVLKQSLWIVRETTREGEPSCPRWSRADKKTPGSPMTSWVFFLPTAPQIVSPHSQPWEFSAQVFKQSGPPAPELYLFNYGDMPGKSFLCIGSVVVEADKEIQLILDKTKTHNRSNIITVSVCLLPLLPSLSQGTEGKWGDFKMASGEIVIGNQTKGTIVELFHPFCFTASGQEGMEFQQSLQAFMKRIGLTVPENSSVGCFLGTDKVQRTLKYMAVFARALKS